MLKVFKYTAVAPNGAFFSGSKITDTKDSLMSEIKREFGEASKVVTCHLNVVETIRKGIAKKGFSTKEVVDFLRFFRDLIGIGVDFRTALRVIRESTKNKKFETAVLLMESDIEKGFSLKETFDRAGVFPEAAILSVGAGEDSGNLDESLAEVIAFYETEVGFKKKIISAMMLPAIEMAVVIIVAGVFFLVGIPGIRKIVKVQPEGIAGLVFTISDFLMKNIWVLLVAIAALGFMVFITWKKGFFKRLPIIRDIVDLKLYSSFFFGLTSFQKSGVPIAEAVSSSVSANKTLVLRGFQDVVRLLKNGEKISVAVGNRLKGYPIVKTSLSVGEASGNMEECFRRIAIFFKRRLEEKLAILPVITEPLVIMLVGAIVGLLAYTMYNVIYGSINIR